ncbi:hypothetical protein [Mesorhizobium sp. M7A.F.Ca.US.008.03.1.1]|uniref:hypothetical protein n=1 Tax=Mesorhizobium sp. M7A.F.Ca.US.008.03.1.1 TaxID=2496742 RepID=UPI000FCBC726|nr:hypothetical protein [Mesorhizobium sp. M7A.F.Ca.US.008.03.1.1]RUW58360.1 hypothetical protein EOA16_28025 [Mesorhizobium sp. M7A.F.Ca.US.008.03.1.1]
MPDEEQRITHCQQCRLSIPEGAQVCTHCQSYQDWRRWFAVSSTVLALLTALISVLSFAVPSFITLLHKPHSDMSAPMISLEGTTIRLLVVNNGDAPGVFVRADTESEYLAPATKIRLRDDQKAIIAPGSNLLMFDVVPLLSGEQSYRNSLEMLMLVEGNKEVPKTDIVFVFGDSDGELRVSRLSLDADKMFELMRANSDRCSAIKEPDFYNGCVGPGELAPDTGPGSTTP